MDLLEFTQKIVDHSELEPVGVDMDENGEERYIVRHKPTLILTGCGRSGIDKASWEAVLTCKREPNPLMHVTRVVGYFSKTENGNRSKLGERLDRNRGNYKLE